MLAGSKGRIGFEAGIGFLPSRAESFLRWDIAAYIMDTN